MGYNPMKFILRYELQSNSKNNYRRSRLKLKQMKNLRSKVKGPVSPALSELGYLPHRPINSLRTLWSSITPSPQV